MVTDRQTLLTALLDAYVASSPDLDRDTYQEKLENKCTVELVEIAQSKFPSLLESVDLDDVFGIDPDAPDEWQSALSLTQTPKRSSLSSNTS